VEELSPCPQYKILAVSFLALFKLFRRLPVISLSELLFVGYIFAPSKKTPKLSQIRAPML
jgi:hypothetical protein